MNRLNRKPRQTDPRSDAEWVKVQPAPGVPKFKITTPWRPSNPGTRIEGTYRGSSILQGEYGAYWVHAIETSYAIKTISGLEANRLFSQIDLGDYITVDFNGRKSGLKQFTMWRLEDRTLHPIEYDPFAEEY